MGSPRPPSTGSPSELMEHAAIAQWLSERTGLNPAILGPTTLHRAVNRRRQASGAPDDPSYLQLLLNSEPEQMALLDLLVVPESWFFRDRPAYGLLARQGRRHLEAPPDTPPLRLLSAPCASGEEPYSMAMTLLDLGLPPSRFQIEAIDISATNLARARRGIYGRNAFRGVAPLERQRHFEPHAEGWSLNPEVRACVHLRQGNLLDCLDRLSVPYDLVFCRNLLIYLEDAAITSLLASLARLLRPGGLLLVAAVEMARVPAALFEPLGIPSAFAYRRRAPLTTPEDAVVPPPLAPLPARPLPDELARCSAQLQRDPTRVSLYLRQAELLIERRQPQQAVSSLRKGLYLQPRSREILERLIALCRSLGDLEQSEGFEARLARLTLLER